jgi:cytochrome c oxidase subunit 2
MRVAAAVVAGLALAAVPAALAADPGFSPPSPATPSGDAISQLYWFVFAICAVVFVAVESALVLFVIRFRRRGAIPDDAEGPQVHGNTRLEIIWTIIPALILVGIAIVVFVRTPAVQATDQSEAGELRVRVEAHQFYWQYVYPDGGISLDRLVVPVDRPVTLELVSFDVNHSWWVPELTGKRDAIPGRLNELSFRPTEEGSFGGRCAELCGLLHADMPTDVAVVSQSEYEQFLARLEGQEDGAGQAALGKATWERVCARCHGLDGSGDIGPPVQGNGTLTNLEALEALGRDGQDTPAFDGSMPPVGRGWPDHQYEALMAYVQSNEKLAGPAGQEESAQSGG